MNFLLILTGCMSWQFESLSLTSKLPDWIDEEVLHEQWLLIMGGTHGEEEGQIEYVSNRMDRGRLAPGILPIIANRLAVELKERSVSGIELMSCYPGNFSSIVNEDRTAAGITWLIDHLNSKRLAIDRHENNCDNRFLLIGSQAVPAALTAGWILGHTDVWITRWLSFNNTSPSILGVEEAAPQLYNDRLRYFAETDSQLNDIAKLGFSGLTEAFYDEAVSKQLRYFEFAPEPILINPTDRTLNQDVLAILPELEESGVKDGTMTAITLSRRAQEVLQLPPRQQYYAVSGAYDNRSAPVENSLLGLPDDIERRLVWGAIIFECPPPQLDPDSEILTATPLNVQ